MDKTLSLICSKTKHMIDQFNKCKYGLVLYILIAIRKPIICYANEHVMTLQAISTSATNDVYVNLTQLILVQTQAVNIYCQKGENKQRLHKANKYCFIVINQNIYNRRVSYNCGGKPNNKLFSSIVSCNKNILVDLNITCKPVYFQCFTEMIHPYNVH